MRKRKTYGFICAILAAVFGGGVARANQCVWIGSGSGNGKNVRFSTSSNWSCTGGATPASTDDYFFDPTLTINTNTGKDTKCTFDNNAGDIAVKSITIGHTYSATITGNSSANAVSVSGSWTMSTGTFAGSTGSLTISGNLALSGGAFTATSGTTSVAGSFSEAGAGTFSANGGTVTLTGSGSITGATGTNEFNKLTISGAYTLGGDLATGSDLTLTGSLDTSSHGLSVGGSLSVGDGVTYAADPTLVGYWAFDDAAHTLDSSGNGHALTWSVISSVISAPTRLAVVLAFDPRRTGPAWRMTGKTHQQRRRQAVRRASPIRQA